MKKLLLLAAMAVSLAFVACNKEEENSLDDRLVNTKWETSDTVYEIIYGGSAYDVYDFISATEVENYTTKNNKVVKFNGTYSYTLNYPKLTIDEGDEVCEFEFQDSRTMIRQGASIFYSKYIKQ